MFKILDIYIGKTILATISLTLATLVGLSGIIKYVEQLRKVGKGSYDMLQALFYVLLEVPWDIEMFFPMATLLGALIALGMLASSSELTVMQASGFSKLDIGLSVLKTALPLMIMVMALGEWGSPQSAKLARDIRSFALSGGNIVSVRSGVWAKDSSDFIFVGQVDDETLNAVNIWKFDQDKKLTSIVSARKAEFVGDQLWTMYDAQVTDVTDRSLLTKETFDTYAWKTSLEPDKLSMATEKTGELSLSGIYQYVQYLKATEQDASKYELAFWRKLFQPLSIAVMMLMALSFVFGPLRSVSMGARVVSGIVAGFTFYITSEFFGPLSLVYDIPAVIGAVAPSILFLGLAIMLLRRKL